MKIKHLTDIEHILLRPSIYIGEIEKNNYQTSIYMNDKIIKKDIEYSKGLLKLFNELIDNTIDEYLRHNIKDFNICIKIDEKSFSIKDNGNGIPIKKIKDNKNKDVYIPFLVWKELKAGSNFIDDKHNTKIGRNGVGASLCSVFSKKFIGISYNKTKQYIFYSINNQSKTKGFILKNINNYKGVYVYFEPDLKRFNEIEINKNYIELIKSRLYAIKITYPNVNITFNDEVIETPTYNFLLSKQYKNNFFGINISDEFIQNTIVSSLIIEDGTHINFIKNEIAKAIIKKLKTLKNLKIKDVLDTLELFVITNNFTPKFNTQTKDYISNNKKDIESFYKDELNKFINLILKNQEILTTIKNKYEHKEEIQEIKKINKKQKKYEKFISSINNNECLYICEGASALNSLMPILGRKNNAYYELKGKPLNVFKNKLSNNKELLTLYNIIKDYDFNKIIIATDSDLDGLHIRLLLLGFFYKYLKNKLDNIYILNTPIYVEYDNKDNPKKWYYNFNEIKEAKKGSYKKGLGSWNKKELQYIINKDTLENMTEKIEFDNIDILNIWLNNEADLRKKEIEQSTFDLNLL